MSAYTKGPLSVRKKIGTLGAAVQFVATDELGRQVGHFNFSSNGSALWPSPAEAEANAHLYASAPALVSALEDAVHRVRWLMQFVPDTDPIDEELARWDAALRLARGEE